VGAVSVPIEIRSMHPSLRVTEAYCIDLFYSNVCRFHVGKVIKTIFYRLKAAELNEIRKSYNTVILIMRCGVLISALSSGL